MSTDRLFLSPQLLHKILRSMMFNSFSRKNALAIVERKLYKQLVESPPDDGYPRCIHESKFLMLRGLLRSFDRVLDRGVFSHHAFDKFLVPFIDNFIYRRKYHGLKCSMKHVPDFLVISPDHRCNLKCKGCYAASSNTGKSKLDYELVERIQQEKEELWGSFFTVISGGEPFLWKSDGHDIIDVAKNHPAAFFLVFTNGLLLDNTTVDRIAEAGNITPSISIEGFEKETDARRGKGVFKKILEAFERLRDRGVPFGISITATRDNWEKATSKELAEYYFKEQCAFYGWIFQYMPIGRGHTVSRMVPPSARLEMLRRTWKLVESEGIMLADFWNSALATNGCISAGRERGYFHINWNGDVTPCVFSPFTTHNIKEVYSQGGDLNTLLDSNFFRTIRNWQEQHGYDPQKTRRFNWLCSCPIRDHFREYKDMILTCNASPIDTSAAAALKDDEYLSSLTEYDQELEKLAAPLWDGGNFSFRLSERKNQLVGSSILNKMLNY